LGWFLSDSEACFPLGLQIRLSSSARTPHVCLQKTGIANCACAYYSDFMHTISLKLPESLLARLEQESRARRVNKSALVRAALERELAPPTVKEQPSCYDLARDLAGSIKGLPKDIATNPKYMKGFGE
jgi:hypothetical protein